MANSKEITHITMSEANTLGVLNPLISFNCLIDTDFGLLVLIAQKFFDTSIFSEEFFNENSSIMTLQDTVYNRKEKNPLLLCMKSERYSDEYYNQFMNEEYDSILERSMITDLVNNLGIMENSGAIFSILCKNESEIKLLDNIKELSKYNKVLIDDLDLSMFNQIFIKSYDDYGMDKLKGINMLDKHIYIARYKFNETKNLNEKDAKVLFLLDKLRCEITKFDLYTTKENSDNER